jgi:adenylosuccinate synthase
MYLPQNTILFVFKEVQMGHTLEFDGIKHVQNNSFWNFHKTAVNVIGNGVVIDPVVLIKKLKVLRNLI